MKFLVTGGAGFIGSAFVRMLLADRRASRVINLDKLTYAGNLENLNFVAADACTTLPKKSFTPQVNMTNTTENPPLRRYTMKRSMHIFALIMFVTACGTATETITVDSSRPSISVQFSFNPESYPRFIRKVYPQVAVWAAVADGTKASTIYVTEKGARDGWWGADRRPSALPVWYGVRASVGKNGIDAMTGATPSGESFQVSWNVPPGFTDSVFDIFVEANISFDYNEHFPKTAKEGDNGYSDVNGQPSLVWKARIDPSKGRQEIIPKIIGHGHVLGKDHAISADMEKITTAKGLFHYVKVVYDPGK